MNVNDLNLDVSKQPAVTPVLYLGQGDKNGTTLRASIYDDGAQLSLSGKSAKLCMRSPDGQMYYEVNGTVSGNVATFQINEEYAAGIAGVTDVAYVEVLEGSTVVCSTNRFRVVVLESAQEGADPEQAYSNGIMEAIDDAHEAADDARDAADEAREAAGGTVPLMSPIQRGGAKLGSGLSMDGEALNLGPLVKSTTPDTPIDGSGIFGVQGEGWAEQDTTTGKNLLPNNAVSKTINGVTYTKNADGSITLNGTCTATTWFYIVDSLGLEAGTYTLSGTPSNVPVGTALSTDGTFGVSDLSTFDRPLTFPVSQATSGKIIIRVGSGAVLSNVTFYPQIEAGSTATAYEPYTGGIPSPNPSYPQEIRVARGRNLSHCAIGSITDQGLTYKALRDSVTVSGTMAGSAGERVIALSNIVSSIANYTSYSPIAAANAFMLEPGSYTLSANCDNKCEVFLIYGEINGTVNAGTAQQIGVASTTRTATVNISSQCYGMLVIHVVASQNESVNRTVSNIQLEQGTTPTPYVPYGYIGLDVTANGQTTTTPIPLPAKGFLAALPDGTKDTLAIDSAGGVKVKNSTWKVVLGSFSFTDTSAPSSHVFRLKQSDLPTSIIAPDSSVATTALCSNYSSIAWGPHSGSDDARFSVAPAQYDRIVFVDHGASTIESFLERNGDAALLYPLATPTTESLGYIALPELPAGATVNIPELDNVGIDYWVPSANDIAEHARETSKAAHELSDKVSTLEAAVATLATS